MQRALDEQTLAARRIGAYIAAAVLLLLLFYRLVQVELFLRRCGAALGGAALLSLAVCGAGLLLQRGRPSTLPTTFLLGYPAFGTICFLVGLIRVNRTTMGAITIAFAAVGIFAIVRRRVPVSQPIVTMPADLFAGGVLILLGALAFLAAQAPPIQLDEVAYHLSVPHEWVKEGRAAELPLISHSYFPLGSESADLPLLAFLGPMRGGIASHFLHLLAAIATAAVALRIANGSLLIVAAILSTPALAITAGWAQADWPLLGVCLVLFTAIREKDDAKISGAIAAGLLTKYTFLPFVAIAAIVSRKWRPIGSGIAIGSVFFLRNLFLTGSPIAPFLTGAAPHVGAYRQLSIVSYVFDRMWLDEALGVASFLLPLLATGFFAAITGVLGVVLLLALTPSSRILVPFFALPGLTAREPGRVLRSLLVAAIVAQTFIVALFINSSHPFDLLSGRQSDEEYVAQNRASFAASRWIDGQLPPDARTLVVGVNETYWFGTAVRGAGNFDSERISRYLENPANLARDRITHVAIMARRRREDASKVAERETVLSPAAKAALAQLLQRSVMIGAREDARLYRLR